MHECAKHASEYRQEQAGTTWGQQREKSSQVLPLDNGNLEASRNMTYPTLPHNIRPLICMHTALVLPHQSSAYTVLASRSLCSCLSGIVFILTAQLLHSCLGTITTSVFKLSVQVHRVRRSTGRSGVQVNRVRRSTGRSGVQVHGVRRSRHVEGRNCAALLEIGASPLGLLSPPHSLSLSCLLSSLVRRHRKGTAHCAVNQ